MSWNININSGQYAGMGNPHLRQSGVFDTDEAFPDLPNISEFTPRARKNGKQKASNWKTYNKNFARDLHDEIINDMFGPSKRGYSHGAFQNVNIKIGANGFGNAQNHPQGASDTQKLQEYQNKISELNEVNHQRKCTISRLQGELEKERSKNQAQQMRIKQLEQKLSDKGKTFDDLKTTPECPICLDNYDEVDHWTARINCGHVFGRSCLLKALRENQRCPKCNIYADERDIQQIFLN